MDSGLHSLITISRLHGLRADERELSHSISPGGAPFDDTAILRAAKELGCKAKVFDLGFASINPKVLPAIGVATDGTYFVIAKLLSVPSSKTEGETDDEESAVTPHVLVQFPTHPTPSSLSVDEFTELWVGRIIAVSAHSSNGEESTRRFGISWFLPFLHKYRRTFAEVIAASFLIQLFALVTPLFFQVVMDKVLVHRGFETLNVLAIGFLGIVVFDAILGGIRNYLFSHTTNRVDVELGSNLFSHLMALPISYFESRQVGQNVARVRELDSIRNFITGTTLTLLIDVSFLFVFLAVMWLYSPLLTGVVVATIPLYIGLSLVVTPSLRRRLEEKFTQGAANTAFLTETITGIGTVKGMALEPQVREQLEERLTRYVNSSFRTQNLGNVANQIAGLINKLMTLGIIWFGAQMVIAGSLTVGQLVAFNMLAARVSAPILKLVQLWQDFQQAGISIDRLGDILNSPREPGAGSGRSKLASITGDVQFDRVRFRYDIGGRIVLDDLTLHVKAGEVVGIVGRSGSGKSTLTKLVQRLYAPESGRILIDGIDVSQVDTSWLRQQIGVVMQDSFLFNRSIRDNIAIANPAMAFDDIVAVAQTAGAHDFIVELPEGYDTLIGENGCNFSGGQVQRIAIARSLVRDPKILIFDEATSALDQESEHLVQQNMSKIAAGRTVFVIAHRLSTVRHSDRIVVMDRGAVAEQGSHDELIALGGLYRALHDPAGETAKPEVPVSAVDVLSKPRSSLYRIERRPSSAEPPADLRRAV